MVKSKGGLGRGLDSLIPGNVPTAAVQEVSLDDIVPNPHQPRQRDDEEALAELAESIRQHGLLQPIVVTVANTNPVRYQLIAGERRWRAARLAGLHSVPVVIKDASPQQMLEMALVENIQRADLNPLEEATAYRHLMEDFGLTQEQIAQRVGKSRVAIANSLRLLRLPQQVKDSLAAGEIAEGHARALLALEREEEQLRALAYVREHGLSVRQTEELVRRLQDAPAGSDKPPRRDDAQVRALEDDFRRALGTKVELRRTRSGGRLIIYFFSDEELDGLYRSIVGSSRSRLF